MPPRSHWKGYLKLSLVTCPVSMTPATSDGDTLRFHTINEKTGHRVVSQFVDSVSGKPVAEEDEIKGYPRGENDFVLLEQDEIDRVALDSTRTIDIETFVPAGSVDWVWFDKPHYLVPRDEIGAEAFMVIRDAMARTRTVGLSRLVMYRRERAVLLEPRGKGIVLWTLHYGDELRDEADYFGGIAAGKPDAKLLALVRKLIRERSADWTPDMVDDPVQDHLLKLIAQKKKKGRKKVAKPAQTAAGAEGGNVIDIMEALKKSIGAEKRKPG